MAQVLDWQRAADTRPLVDRAVQALVAGQLVAVPTDTTYGLVASALVPEAVERLQESRGNSELLPLTLALRSAAEALDWVPELSPLGQRLARRCWPGPVTLMLDEGVPGGLAGRLPEAVRQRVCPAGMLRLRVPAHEAILNVMRQMPGPLVLTSASRDNEPAAVHAEQVVRMFGDTVDLVIDGGPSHQGQPTSVLRVNGNSWSVLREGAVPSAVLQRQTACLIIFVCTGNTCRSPLAEVLCKKLLAERLECTVAELPQHGFIVISAGLAAMMGGGAAEEAVALARELGADLSGHRSRPLSAELKAQADYLIGMTRSHVLALAEQLLRGGPWPRLLSPDGDDIADPIGCDRAVYQECAHQIARHLDKLVAEFTQVTLSAAQPGTG